MPERLTSVSSTWWDGDPGPRLLLVAASMVPAALVRKGSLS